MTGCERGASTTSVGRISSTVTRLVRVGSQHIRHHARKKKTLIIHLFNLNPSSVLIELSALGLFYGLQLQFVRHSPGFKTFFSAINKTVLEGFYSVCIKAKLIQNITDNNTSHFSRSCSACNQCVYCLLHLRWELKCYTAFFQVTSCINILLQIRISSLLPNWSATEKMKDRENLGRILR